MSVDTFHIPPKQIIAVPTGTLLMYGGSTAPAGFLLCDGTSYKADQYPDLFKAIGSSFGGSGGSFNVPDMRSRLPIGFGQGSGLTNRALAATGGVETLTPAGTNSTPTFSGNALAGHAHTTPATDVAQAGGNPSFGTGTTSNQVPGMTTSTVGAGTPSGSVTAPTFTGTSGNSMNPFLCVNFIIKI